LTWCQLDEQLLDRHPRFRRVERRVVGTEVDETVRVGLLVPGRGQRDAPVAAGRLERLQDGLDRHAGVAGDLLDGGGATEDVVQLVHRDLDGVLQILGAARDVDSPGRVPEVTTDLAGDRRYGERREGRAVVGVEAFDGLE